MDSKRRFSLMLMATAPLLLALTWTRSAAAPPKISVMKDPDCDCCSAWAEHLRSSGFEVETTETTDLKRVKTRLEVPAELASCHTAQVDTYVVEGHVPASAIRRLLDERPRATGLAVPGMPIGSPGMEVPGTPDNTYEVILFAPTFRRTFARFKGVTQL
jgi:hypothetical protein